MSSTTSHQRWIVHGLSAGATGLLFGLVISVAVVVALQAGVGWVELLERRGIDATMRLAVLLRSSDLPAPIAPSTAVHPITFIDIDEYGCKQLSGSAARCMSEGTALADVLIPVGEALRGSGAEVVILDMTWPEAELRADPILARRMMDAWAYGAGPAIVAALPGAPGQNGVLAVDWTTVPGNSRPVGRLHFGSPTFAIDPKAGDMVIRNFPTSIPFFAAGGAPREGDIPTLPALAVAVSRGDILALKTTGSAAQTSPDEEPRIFFSLPSLANPSGHDLEGAYVGNYALRQLSKMLSGDSAGDENAPTTGIDVRGLAGQIVIVGSSAAAAQDWHITPLGAMPGAEIVANATRAVEAFPPLRSAPLFDGFWTKVLQTLAAALIMTIAWLAIMWLRAKRETRAGGGGIYTFCMFVVFVAGSIMTFTFNIGLNISELIEAPRQGQTSDVLLPTLAVLLEGFVDFGKWVTDKVETAIAAGLIRLADLVRGVSERP